jgi:hypothetical protein
MLRISKIKEVRQINNESITHYPFDLKIGNRKINLNGMWSEISFHSEPKLLRIENRLISKTISKNFYHYLRLPKINQDRCLTFSKFLINSNHYNKQKLSDKNISFGQIVKFFQKQNQKPYFIHASVSLGNGLLMSKIGYMGIYIQDIQDTIDFYEADEEYVKICSSSNILSYQDKTFYRNINIPNTFGENEE